MKNVKQFTIYFSFFLKCYVPISYEKILHCQSSDISLIIIFCLSCTLKLIENEVIKQNTGKNLRQNYNFR